MPVLVEDRANSEKERRREGEKGRKRERQRARERERARERDRERIMSVPVIHRVMNGMLERSEYSRQSPLSAVFFFLPSLPSLPPPFSPLSDDLPLNVDHTVSTSACSLLVLGRDYRAGKQREVGQTERRRAYRERERKRKRNREGGRERECVPAVSPVHQDVLPTQSKAKS